MMIPMADRLPRCRTCPRCGSRKSLRVARSFGAGTWRRCNDCLQQFRPPVSLLVSITAILFGSFLLLTGTGFGASLGATDMLTLIFGGVGAVFTLWGAWQIVRCAKTPVGPLPAFAVGFAVAPVSPPAAAPGAVPSGDQ
jgi:hypothetical protein